MRKPSSRQRANTRTNFSGGWSTSLESSPTPMKCSRYGRAASSVANASASLRWRRKHRIRAELMPSFACASAQARDSPWITVAMGTPRAVCVCGSKKISVWIT
ncbi:hypothetical protein D9M68_764960 [compost metagenome]